MARDLSRLFRARSIAVIGGGAWGRAVVEQCRKMDFAGMIWPVHPKADMLGGLTCFPSLRDLPAPPDAAFIGVNRHGTVAMVHELQDMGAGGAVCFAAGFLEAGALDRDGADLQERLLDAAQDMPILGPNCYGFINYLDGVLLWPDQHGGQREETGVAIVTQSSNIAINLSMQRRALPIAYIVTAGNQVQTGIAEIGETLLEDPRVSTLGLHIEGFGDLRSFERLAARGRAVGKPIVALKVGKSDQARAATVSHTASLAGADAGAQAFLDRLGIPRVHSLSELLETLKLLHVAGPLPSRRIASLSCSGGEASLVVDTAIGQDLVFPPLTAAQETNLRAVLGPMVALANPLDYHTHIWRDVEALTRTFTAMMAPAVALTLIILDFPRPDRCDDGDWTAPLEAAYAAKKATGGNLAIVATLSENMPEAVARRMLRAGIVPLFGLAEALAAAAAAAKIARTSAEAPTVLHSIRSGPLCTISEIQAKARLAAHGLIVPSLRGAASPEEAAACARELGFPVVLKGEGVAHKSETGSVVLNLNTMEDVVAAARAMPANSFLVEEMITDAVAELLMGVVRDPAHGFVLTIAAGGVLTELVLDRQSLLVPATPETIADALDRLRVARLLDGYRGRPAADRRAILRAAMALQDFVRDNARCLEEVEINPLLCSPTRAVAADALLICQE